MLADLTRFGTVLLTEAAFHLPSIVIHPQRLFFLTFNRIISMVYSFTLDLVTRTTFWNTTSGVFCIWLCHIGFSQSCVQRLVSLPSLRAAKRSMIIFFLGVVFIMTFNCGIGIIMYAYYYACDPVKEKIVTKYDKLMPRFVEDVSGHITGMSGEFCKQIINDRPNSRSV